MNDVAPPNPKKIPHTIEKHGHERIDPYYWLRDRENPEVIAHLEAENAYTDAVMQHTEPLQEKLYEEIKGRIKETDLSVPYRLDDYFYYVRTEEGQSYPIFCRRYGSMDAPEETMLDVNEVAEGHEYCAVSGGSVSIGQDILAYATDFEGRRIYSIRFRDLKTGKDLPDEISNVTPNMAWAKDNKTLFYTKQHPETLRPYQIYRHELGTDPSDDVLVYEEEDDTFYAGVGRTKSKEYIFIVARHTVMSEFRFLRSDNPKGEFQLFEPRQRDHEYAVEHFEDSFYIRTNWDAPNFRLMKTPVSATSRDNWTEVVQHRGNVLLESAEFFKNYLVLEERQDGLMHIRVRPWDDTTEHYLDFGEPAYSAHTGANFEFDTPVLRYSYSSLTTPGTVYDYNMETREKVLLKQQEVVGDFQPVDYATERLHATAPDGTDVPISIVYRKDFEKNGERPCLLYGYGSYGISVDPTFSSARLSLLDRGFVVALAHIRGGEELGRHWYESGKLLTKKNTFTDFIACAEHLVDKKYTNADKLFAMGGSAGGLLIGAVINLRPDLFKGVIASVPFVDVLTTMLDEDIPLTTHEYDEWGNPGEKEFYDYILSYSPYDNVEAKEYPHILVETGFHDSQVQYWEPAKWVAKLRDMKTDDHRLIFKVHMEAGHSGKSGRYEQYKEIAFEYAFMLDLLGINE